MNNISNTGPNTRQWLVELLSIRVSDDHQRQVIDDLGIRVFDVVRVWLDVIIHHAHSMGGNTGPITELIFETRADARRFLKTWSGKLK